MNKLLPATELGAIKQIPTHFPTAISARLSDMQLNDELSKPVTHNQYIVRARALPLLAQKQSPNPNGTGFAAATNLSTLDLRALGLIAHGFSPRDRKTLAKPIPPIQHMVLIAYEATPRPISFAMNGYSASDFIAYIYQDVAERFINTPLMRSPEFTREKAKAIKAWLAQSVPRKQHTPQRHIRRRLMGMFNRTNQQINSLFIDREISPEMMMLFLKLMERDDNLGYMEGQLRDFHLVRSDFNLLAETITLSHFLKTGDFEKADAFRRVDCPSVIEDFDALQIDKPRSKNKPE